MIYRVCRKIIKIITRLLPINNKKIIFSNFFAQSYGDNPKFITEELLYRNADFKIIWLLKDCNVELDERIIKVKYPSIRAIYEYSTSKFIVQNIRNFHLNKKRKKQVYIQTWHGAGASKLIEGFAEKKLSPTYIKEAKYDGEITNAIIADDDYAVNVFKNGFWLNKDTSILKVGSPSYDYLVNNKNNDDLIKKLKKKYNCVDDFVVLYAPTFRDNNSLDGYISEFDSLIESFKRITNKKVKIIVRFHPNVDDIKIKIKYNDNIIRSYFKDDIKELDLISNCLITDYSSIMYDYLLLEKPVFRYVSDIDDYQENRGLPQKYFEYPFAICKNISELCDCISSFDNDVFIKAIKKYKKNNKCFNDGNSSKKIVDWIFENN